MKPVFKTLLVIVVFGVIGAIIIQYRQPRFIAGETAADFSATLPDSSSVKLSDLRGKYVVLQFWGSWCGPCRRENPALVSLYNRYHDKGLEIFSVGIENGNTNGWKKAIQADQMVWPYHTVQTDRFDGPIARLYNIHSIPTIYLINPDGKIMGVNLTPEAIEKSLEHQLAAY